MAPMTRVRWRKKRISFTPRQSPGTGPHTAMLGGRVHDAASPGNTAPCATLSSKPCPVTSKKTSSSDGLATSADRIWSPHVGHHMLQRCRSVRHAKAQAAANVASFNPQQGLKFRFQFNRVPSSDRQPITINRCLKCLR